MNRVPVSTAEYKPTGPDWALGCEQCHCGIVVAPDRALASAPLNWQRAMGLQLGLVVFCSCRAGQAQERSARKLLESLPNRCAVAHEDGKLTWAGSAPNEYIPGEWWRQMHAIANHVPSFHMAEG